MTATARRTRSVGIVRDKLRREADAWIVRSDLALDKAADVSDRPGHGDPSLSNVPFEHGDGRERRFHVESAHVGRRVAPGASKDRLARPPRPPGVFCRGLERHPCDDVLMRHRTCNTSWLVAVAWCAVVAPLSCESNGGSGGAASSGAGCVPNFDEICGIEAGNCAKTIACDGSCISNLNFNGLCCSGFECGTASAAATSVATASVAASTGAGGGGGAGGATSSSDTSTSSTATSSGSTSTGG